MLQIQKNLQADGSVQDISRVAVVEVDSKTKIGASLGYNVRTLLKDLGLEVCSALSDAFLTQILRKLGAVL